MKRIYVIDDDMDDIEFFRDALEEIAPHVSLQYANDCHEAVRSLTEQKGALPDLVFLDISMPVFNGLQCLASFKKDDHLRGLPVIMYSTSSREGEVKMAKQLGALAYVTKPNNFRLLKRIITLVLDTPLDELPDALRKIARNE